MAKCSKNVNLPFILTNRWRTTKTSNIPSGHCHHNMHQIQPEYAKVLWRYSLTFILACSSSNSFTSLTNQLELHNLLSPWAKDHNSHEKRSFSWKNNTGQESHTLLLESYCPAEFSSCSCPAAGLETPAVGKPSVNP